jgi:ribosomal protein S18 acetylase RimI-like enzyme
MKIRDATEEDLNQLAPIQMQIQELHRSAHPEIYPAMNLEACRSGLSSFLTDSSATIIVADDSERLCGYVTLKIEEISQSVFRHADRIATVDQLAVDESAQGRGVGTTLMQEVDRRARKSKCSQIRLDVLTFNEKARSFYERIGFTPIRLRMSRKLS